jgi:hypothetical protein
MRRWQFKTLLFIVCVVQVQATFAANVADFVDYTLYLAARRRCDESMLPDGIGNAV